MDYRDLVFLSVAENLSISKASKELFISQPAVTNHIKKLEERLQVRLFDRKGNRIYLTATGSNVYASLKQIKQAYDDMEFRITEMQNTHKGSLHIGASSSIAQYYLPHVVAAYNKRYPHIEIFLYNANSFQVEQQLLADEINLALVENKVSHPNIHYTEFLTDEIVVVTGSTSVYARKKSLQLSDLLKIPLVLREKGSGTLEVIKDTLQKQGVAFEQLPVSMHLGSTEAIKNFLIGFDGIALLSEKSIEKELRLKELTKLKIKGVDFTRSFRVAQRQGEQNHIAKHFISFLLTYK